MSKSKTGLKWLRAKAKIEDGSLVSVGGLVADLKKSKSIKLRRKKKKSRSSR